MLTGDSLLTAMREMKRKLADLTVAPAGPMRYDAMPIVYSPYALKDTDQRLFRASKNRSKRIHKKLVKRFGGEFRKQPCIWRVGNTIYAHPSFRSQLEAQFKETNDETFRPLYGTRP